MNIISNDFKYKKEQLEKLLLRTDGTLYIACSGGLDSRLLAFFAKHIGIKNIELLHVTGAHIDPSETSYLKEWVEKNKLALTLVPLPLLSIEEIGSNDPLRCYYCKKTAFSTLLTLCKENSTENSVLHDGTHFDDTKSHRPGLQALKELNIISPLALSGFNKKDIQALAIEIGLENPYQKAKPCLLTRFPYHTHITEEKLQFIAYTENIITQEFQRIYQENECPTFRFREVKTNTYELHTEEKLSDSIIEALQATLKKVNINIIYRHLPCLSGFFDTKNI